jgi:hypothetical protein
MAQAVPVVRLATINPHNGPATRPDWRYAEQVRNSQAAGLDVLGYVYTGYADDSRSIAAVAADIDKYYAWYAVDGIVFDEASTDCSRQPYYAVLNSYVKQKGGKAITVLNPGTWTEECYMTCADIIITFEDTYSAYIARYRAPRWARKYDPGRFWHLIHSTPTEEDMLHVVRLSKARRAGWVYVTSDEMPNPWDTLPAPAYWAAELEAVASD